MPMKSFSSSPNLKSMDFCSRLRITFLSCAAALLLMFTVACNTELRKTDAQLGLNPQQAAGRRVFDQNCDRCHEAYSSRAKKSESLKGLFKRQFLPKSGLPVNDQQVLDIIRYGRNMMPGFGRVLSQQETDDLLAYLHTL
jgi:mono/diheme cytochrome c family protein